MALYLPLIKVLILQPFQKILQSGIKTQHYENNEFDIEESKRI